MRFDGPRKQRNLGKDDWRQATYDSGLAVVGKDEESPAKRREPEAVFEVENDSIHISGVTEPLAIQAQRPPELKIVRGVPTPESADPFGDTAMSSTTLQPKVRIVEGTPLPKIELSNDEQRRIEEVRKIIAESDDNMDRTRKSA
ncbi:MAG: hypothetical protein KBD73_03825 [Candidatus Magasanikbacteria bacterium]|nr:hypothetical protein [Candidatus Magasanikbacteria bacterium]